jgi:hypothetical protein
MPKVKKPKYITVDTAVLNLGTLRADTYPIRGTLNLTKDTLKFMLENELSTIQLYGDYAVSSNQHRYIYLNAGFNQRTNQ